MQILVSRKLVETIIRKSFPDYRGRKVKFQISPTVTFMNTNWTGGSKNEYVALRADGAWARLDIYAPWANPVEGQIVDLPKDILVVERKFFCGKDAGVTIWANPQNLPKWLPETTNS